MEKKKSAPTRKAAGRPGELVRRQQAFLSEQTHALRAHLHGLMGYTGLVLRKSRGCLPAQQEENLNKVLRCAEELKSAIDRLEEFPFQKRD
ncbi:MAG: hypothetical protein MUF69_01240 [Desulfobacterota bacterium]|jgi:signal transduction histidine kinase|nr:hypothetical protein [Thermodesulfobacteriota bacterium]